MTRRESAFPRVFGAIGWGLVAAWVTIYAFVLTVNRFPGAVPSSGPAKWIFGAVYFFGQFAPLWLLAALALGLLAAWRRRWPTFAEGAVFLLVILLPGLYLLFAFQD